MKLVRTAKLMGFLLMAWLVLVGLTFVALAAEEPDLAPIISLLPEEPVLFGVAGGLIVTMLVSLLKHFRIVGKDGPIPSRVANFALSVVVAALAMIVDGQSVGAAFLTALSSIIVAAGAHSEIGHPLYSAAERVLGKS